MFQQSGSLIAGDREVGQGQPSISNKNAFKRNYHCDVLAADGAGGTHRVRRHRNQFPSVDVGGRRAGQG